MATKFAKLFEDASGEQTLVTCTPGEEGGLELSYQFQVEGIGVVAVRAESHDTDEARDMARKVFDELDAAKVLDLTNEKRKELAGLMGAIK